MDLTGKKIVVIGGAGLIGSHTVDHLVKEDVKEILIYDNFLRGSRENLQNALKDPRVKIYDVGGDIMQTDILQSALEGADGVFHLAALWLLQCHEYPRSAFDVNVRGTFNVMEACVAKGVKRLVYSSSASVYGDAVREPMDEDHPYNNKNFYGATKICGEAMAPEHSNTSRRACALTAESRCLYATPTARLPENRMRSVSACVTIVRFGRSRA